MRSTVIEILGQSHELRATWAAGEAIKVACGMDPLQIGQEAQMEAAMAERGLPYRGKFDLSMKSIYSIIACGMKAGGSDLTADQIRDGIMEMGLEAATEKAFEFLTLFIKPKSAEVKATDGEGAPPEK